MKRTIEMEMTGTTKMEMTRTTKIDDGECDLAFGTGKNGNDTLNGIWKWKIED